MLSTYTIGLAILLLSMICVNGNQYLDPVKVAKQQSSSAPPPCRLCTVFVKSFNRAMEKTAKGKHSSGDTAWEEATLKKYRESEMRLIDIEKHLCKDTDRHEFHCTTLYGEIEEDIYNWFTKLQDTEQDLHKWLCIDRQEVCCPPNHYGKNCLPCSDCNNNGACKGNGTRKGNGKCACQAGYEGEGCEKCTIQYYESYRDEEKFLCSPCHVACDTNAGCTGAGPRSCRVCQLGWTMQPDDGGCIDIDECALQTDTCKTNEFCVNNDGSFECLQCDRSCDGCTGDGPDLCVKCADGYALRDGLCTVIDDIDSAEADAEGSDDDKEEEEEEEEEAKDEL